MGNQELLSTYKGDGLPSVTEIVDESAAIAESTESMIISATLEGL